MQLGGTSIETWIPAGGFRIAKRRLQTPDHGIIVADCLVPKWENAQLSPVRPCELSLVYIGFSPIPRPIRVRL